MNTQSKGKLKYYVMKMIELDFNDKPSVLLIFNDITEQYLAQELRQEEFKQQKIKEMNSIMT